MAAGQAVRENFEAVTVEGAGAAATDEAEAEAADEAVEALSVDEGKLTAAADAAAADAAAADAAAAVPATEPPTPAAPAPFPVSDAQAAILTAATSAVLAVNGRESAPLATHVRIHWDGETVRFGSLGWSRRTTAIRMDPRVTLYVEDPESDGFLAIEGRAEFIMGADARDAMAPLLSSTGDPAEVERNWAALMAVDADRVVVVVRPSKALPGRRS